MTNEMKQKNNIFKQIDSILIFIFCVLLFTFLVKYVPTDIQLHNNSLEKRNLENAPYPPNFLYFFLVNLFSGFSNNRFLMDGAAIILLSLATTAKFIISKIIIVDLSKTFNIRYSHKNLSLIALALFFCFAIPDFYNIFISKKMYIGKFVPTVWHNSTTIFLFPIAILLFWKQLKVFDNNTILPFKDLVLISFLVIINILIKPSFIFVYIPVTFLMLLKSFRTDNPKRFLLKLTPLFIGGLLILLQYILIYHFEYGILHSEPSSVKISAPFELLRKRNPIWYIPISFFSSLALPLLSMITYRKIFKFMPFVYALCLTIVGILISAFILESGPRMWHGNFGWQNKICTYLLMLSTITFIIPKIKDNIPDSRTTKFLLIVIVVHSLSGIIYI